MRLCESPVSPPKVSRKASQAFQYFFWFIRLRLADAVEQPHRIGHEVVVVFGQQAEEVRQASQYANRIRAPPLAEKKNAVALVPDVHQVRISLLDVLCLCQASTERQTPTPG